MKGTSAERTAFSVLDVLGAAVLIAAVIAFTSVSPARAPKSLPQNGCVRNLLLIDGAKRQWALDHNKQSTDTPTGTDLQPYLGHGSAGKLPACPADSTQTWEASYAAGVGNVATKPTCCIVPSSHYIPRFPWLRNMIPDREDTPRLAMRWTSILVIILAVVLQRWLRKATA
jgi:hypothetical protein